MRYKSISRQKYCKCCHLRELEIITLLTLTQKTPSSQWMVPTSNRLCNTWQNLEILTLHLLPASSPHPIYHLHLQIHTPKPLSDLYLLTTFSHSTLSNATFFCLHCWNNLSNWSTFHHAPLWLFLHITGMSLDKVFPSLKHL